VIEHQTGNTVEIEVHFPHLNWNVGFHRGSRVDLFIHMPRAGSVNLHTGDGAITLTGLKGNVETRTGDGSQEIDAAWMECARARRRWPHPRRRPF